MIGYRWRKSDKGISFGAFAAREQCGEQESQRKWCGMLLGRYAARLGVSKLAPHDLRRSCARFCHDSGGELEQIQFLLGHVSVQTTEKYLGCKVCFRKPAEPWYKSDSNSGFKDDER